jgi:hypothetical protein
VDSGGFRVLHLCFAKVERKLSWKFQFVGPSSGRFSTTPGLNLLTCIRTCILQHRLGGSCSAEYHAVEYFGRAISVPHVCPVGFELNPG